MFAKDKNSTTLSECVGDQGSPVNLDFKIKGHLLCFADLDEKKSGYPFVDHQFPIQKDIRLVSIPKTRGGQVQLNPQIS